MAQRMDDLNRLSGRVVAAAIRIHSRLGPGLLESVYERILAQDLAGAGHVVERQKPISFEFEGLRFDNAFRPDLIIEGKLVVEVKAAMDLAPVFQRQMMTYLKILDLRLGLLLNFGAPLMKNGVKRVING